MKDALLLQAHAYVKTEFIFVPIAYDFSIYLLMQ